MAKVYRIKAQPHATGGRFCRAGRCFGTVAQEFAEDAFTPEELERLKAEPMLVVEIEVRLEPTKPQDKAEAKPKEEAKGTVLKKDAPPTTAPAAPGADAPSADAKAVAAKPAEKPKPAAKEGGK